MHISFNPKSNLFNFKHEQKTVNVAEHQLHVQCHTHFIGLLKFFGKVEDIPDPQGKTVIHVSKASLIQKYREEFHPVGLSDKQIMKIIRASVGKQTPETKPSTETKQKFGTIKEGPLAGITIQSGPIESPATQKAEAHQRAEKIIDDMAVFMKSNLLPENELRSAIKNQYQMLKLMDDQGAWINSEKLKEIGDTLLPPEGATRQECEKFIDTMVDAIKKNPYFLNCIANIPDRLLKQFQNKLKGDKGDKMIKYLIPYAITLNSLTAAFAKDVNLFIEVDKMWTKQKPASVRKYLSLFGWIKYTTLGTLSRIKKPIRTHAVDKGANRSHLNLNIFEAVMADRFFTGNKKNADAGEILLRHPVGGKKNRRTGAGPTTVGVTKGGYEAVKVRPDLPKEWADLYTVWNFAFCSNAGSFPLLALKLLIPSVNDYSNDPQAYINHRAIALYLYFQFSIFRQMAGQNFDYLSDGWNSKEITAALGEANLRSAKEYEKLVKRAKKASR
jgi:hypothetical protein